MNRGVVEAYQQGILSSATLMVNFPGFDDAVQCAGRNPELGVGLHLNIVHGPPVADPARVQSLLNRSGSFPGPRTTLLRLLLGRIRRDELDIELDAQLQRFRERLGLPTHVDSHKHMHVFGQFIEASVDLARGVCGAGIRCPRESAGRTHGLSSRVLKSCMLRWAGGRAKEAYRRAGLNFPDTFTSVSTAAAPSAEAYLNILSSLPDGITEIMCHPGYRSQDEESVSGKVFITKRREPELRALTNPTLKETLTKTRIQLIHYGQM